LETYDYIVVGAGSAGCVVARRLSDDPKNRVLVLEAGPATDTFWIKAPAGMGMLFKSEKYNWNFFTEPVPTLRDRKIYWPRGKGLGGSSAINGLVHIRGDRRDFDHWKRLGNSGWGWDDVLPYFKRSEHNSRGADAFRSDQGPLAVSDSVFNHPSVIDFVEAAHRSGIPRIDDFNAGSHDGVGFLQFNIRNGVRETSYDAFLRPVGNRQNLVVKTETRVRRILFEGRRATGVECSQGDRTWKVAATREVILCAGALNSPHMLMLSGVGDGEMLQKQGIDVLMHAPGVGRNLQDHFSTRTQVRGTPDSSYNKNLRGWRKYWEGIQYVTRRRGYLALGFSTVAAFVRSSPAVEYPDLEISFRPMTFTFKPSGDAVVDSYQAMSASVYRVRPASRGEIVLRSPDPMLPPAFIPNYLSNAEDVEAAVSGMRWLRKILATEPLASRVRGEILPGADVRTDEQLLDYMQREGQCAFHPAGTCKMGNDPMSVVDDHLRVRGVERLRVIDASIMPTVTSGNTNAPTVMIGEKGAEMIRSDAVPAIPAETH
jgi:choline dehydrogenase